MRHLIQNITKNNKKKKMILLSLIISMLAIIMLVITLLFFNKSEVHNNLYTPELSRARSYAQVENGEDAVNGTDNVKFDAFFLCDVDEDGYAEKIRGTCKEIGKTDNLYMELNVQTEGYLKDGKIAINGENFYLQTALPKDEELKENCISINTKNIEFNNIKNGTQKLIIGTVKSGDYSSFYTRASAIRNNINNYSKVNNVTLTGIYVQEDGNEIEITKTVEFNVDWYETATARINILNQSYDISNVENEENGRVELEFSIYTEESRNLLLLKNNYVEGTIPKLNGYEPIEVVYGGNDAEFNYDETTRIFTLNKNSVVDDSGNLINILSRSNIYKINVSYPIEAYRELGTESITLSIPVKTYYEGYNNPNEEFINPYKSNVARGTIILNYVKKMPTQYIHATEFEIQVGKYISSPRNRYIVSKQKPLEIYTGNSSSTKDDIYTVMWKCYIGTNGNLESIVMKETSNNSERVTDQFVKTNSEKESMEDVSSNIGIYFSNATNVLGEDGWINVYDDETDELLITFTKDNWNQYSANKFYKYDAPIEHIRIETSEIVKRENAFYAYNIKEIDDNKLVTKYEKEQFNQLEYIESTLTGYLGEKHIQTVNSQAIYEAPLSIANISISNSIISTQITEENEKIMITTKADTKSNQTMWQNGIFLVKFPKNILDIQINSVVINNSKVSLEGYELIEQDEQKFIKIITKNETDELYTITIDADISADPRLATETKEIELYATNENVSDYYSNSKDIYDVNNNLNAEELVYYTTTNLTMIASNSLITNQTATDYDDKGTVSISPQVAEIKPKYVVVDKREDNTATIGVQVRNNYGTSASEIKILGKIPFKGNTFVTSGKNLESAFTTEMLDTGITIPEELKGIVTVYYSENENPDTDITNKENAWKTASEIENWNNVKTYLIDLNEYVMPVGKELYFTYTVRIPSGTEFNCISYSHFGVYFCLNTEDGKYRTQTEPNRLGFKIAEKYDLELTKYHVGKEKTVPGATYKVTEIIKNDSGTEEKGEARTAVTNEEGNLTIQKLLVGKEYEIQEIISPDKYDLNSDVVRFITHVDEYGNLSVDKLSGATRENMSTLKNEGENYKVIVKVEDDVNVTLKITKTEEGTSNVLKSVRYKITGEGITANKKVLITNINGEATVDGLKIGKEYTLEETNAEGYYLNEPVKFKVVNKNGNYSIEIIEGNTVSQNITENNDIPTVSIALEDKKMPRYNIIINKVAKGTDIALQGAKFKLFANSSIEGNYSTNSEGKIVISDLYLYEEDKGLGKIYTLRETQAPEGYVRIKDIVFYANVVDEKLQLQIQDGIVKEYAVEGNNITITIEDSPNFKLIKKDSETGNLLPNTKFAIYDITTGAEGFARDGKNNIIGTKEIINEKEYYVVTTDENGEIIADLKQGLYKIVEVEALDKYDITSSIYYFGVGMSQEAEESIQIIGTEVIELEVENEHTNGFKLTQDGGYIVFGKGLQKYDAQGNILWEKYDIYECNDVIETNDGNYIAGGAGFLIKCDAEGNEIWRKTDVEKVNTIVQTKDGNYVVGSEGWYWNSNGQLVKYDAEGNEIWKRADEGLEDINKVIEASDGDYVVIGTFRNTLDLGNGIVLESSEYSSGGMIIKYNSNGEIVWANKLVYNEDGYENSWNYGINSIVEDKDNGFIVGGHRLAKYNSEGTNEWSESFENTISNITIINDNELVLEAGNYIISIDNNLNTNWKRYFEGVEEPVVKKVDDKYEVIGIVNNIVGIDGEHLINDYGILKLTLESKECVTISEKNLSYDGIKIEDIIDTSDNGYIIVGYDISDIGYDGPYEDIDDSDEEYDDSDENIDNWNEEYDGSDEEFYDGSYGIIRKYNRNNEIEWTLQEKGNIYGIVQINDNSYIAIVNNTIIKYDENGNIEWKKDVEDKYYCNSIIKTQDGGFLTTQSTDDYYLENKITKFDENGNIEFSVPTSYIDHGSINRIREDSNGNFIINVTISQYLGNGCWTEYEGCYELDKNGNVKYLENVWDKISTSDGGYILIKYNVAEWNYIYPEEYRILKYNANNELQFEKYFEDGLLCDNLNYNLNDIIVLNDGSYLALYGNGLKKINSNGIVEWSKETEFGYNQSISQRTDGSFVLISYDYYDYDYYYGAAQLHNIIINQNIEEKDELIIENERKQFIITTDVNEINGIKGGTISGEDKTPYEKVKYGDSNTKEIIITPNENYEIIGITVNGEEHKFIANEDGTYKMPIFENMTESKEIIVTFALKENKIIINKVDSQTKEPLLDAEFKLDKLDERIELNDVIGELVDNGNGFIETEEGKYESSIQGQDNASSNSYIPIDLRNITGEYTLTINAEISSEYADYGYSIVTTNTESPSINGNFMRISGILEATDYSTVLDGGYIYYLHLVYTKDSSVSTGKDKFVVNNIRVTSGEFEPYSIQLQTNSDGQAISQIPFGKYEITEIKAPEGYQILEEPIIIDFKADQNHEYIIENNELAKVVVHHYKAIPNGDGTYTYIEEKLAEDELLEGKLDDRYSTSPQLDIEDYELIKDEDGNYIIPENATGRYQDGKIEVNYYYIRKASLLVEYIDKETGEKLTESEVTEGHEGDSYKTEEKDFDNYELIEVPENAEGTLKVTIDDEGNIITETVVRYYYKYKEETKVVEKHIDIKSNELLEEETVYTGFVGDEYKTSSKTFEGYDLVEEKLPENAEGAMTSENIEVNYYYIRKASLLVEYIDKETGEKLTESEITEGHEGDSYKTEEKDFDNYELVEVPENAEGTLKVTTDDEGNVITEIVVRYYYKHKEETKVVEKHIDIKSNELLEEETVYTGFVGDEYKTSSKTFEGYDLVEEKLPENAEGAMTSENIEVNYYYIRKASLLVEYVDKETGEKLTESEVTEGHEGDSYKTEEKHFDNYELIEVPENAEGTLKVTTDDEENIITETVVRYYYQKKEKAKVIVKYIDKMTGEEISEEITEDGYVGDEYTSIPKDIDGYVLIEKPEEETVVMTEDVIVLKYYYEKISAGVIEKHIDIKSEEILDNTVYEGTEGTPYTTKEKEFEGYDLVEELYPENAEGVMTVDVIEVKYYYIRKASLLVEYIDKETGEKLTESEVTEGHEGDTYKTEEKDFDNYELIDVPENAEGTLDITIDDEGNVVTETVVRYYYKHKEEATVIEKHVDIENDELLEEETVYTGFVGDEYKTSSKTFEGYDLVEEKLPENAEGTMTADTIEVVYYYSKKQPDVEPPKEKVTIIVEHLEVGTEKKLAEDDIIVGEEGDSYTTNSKNIDGYILVKDRIPNNKEGIMKNGIVVKYYYGLNNVKSEEPVKPVTPTEPTNPEEPPKPVEEVKPSESIKIPEQTSSIKTTTNNSNTTKTRLPNTGDELLIVTITSILFVIALNVVVTVIAKQSHKEPKRKTGRRLK